MNQEFSGFVPIIGKAVLLLEAVACIGMYLPAIWTIARARNWTGRAGVALIFFIFANINTKSCDVSGFAPCNRLNLQV